MTETVYRRDYNVMDSHAPAWSGSLSETVKKFFFLKATAYLRTEGLSLVCVQTDNDIRDLWVWTLILRSTTFIS